MNIKDKKIYIERYSARLKNFGYDPCTLGWGGGRERQELRFKILSDIGITKGDSVLDVGCGFADLYGYLIKTKWEGSYLGIDINRDLLKVALERYPNVMVEEIDILEKDFNRNFDWVVSSGIFNARLYHQDNIRHIEDMLKKFFQISRKGVASDFMSTHVDFQHIEAYHANPSDIINIANSLTWSSVLRMDYLNYEFTVYLYKQINS